jgi:oxamate amidohydrolase
MLHTKRALRGMVVAPHHLAAQAGLRVLQDGGNAIEAMVAAASTIAVVYPHMNSLGGDNFWLVSDGGAPTGIDACGPAAAAADANFYGDQNLDAIPSRGPLAALTVAGAVSGWQAALQVSASWGGKLPLSRLLEDARSHALTGVPVTNTQHNNTVSKLPELLHVPGFAGTFLMDGKPPSVGDIFKQPTLAATLQRLAEAGLDDFYRGDVAASMGADLSQVGSPVTAADLAAHRALTVTPLTAKLRHGRIFKMPPPTQGLASAMILGLFDRLGVDQAEGFDFVHGLVEATKSAFGVRDAHVTDPAYMSVDAQSFLEDAALDERVKTIDMKKAAPFGNDPLGGDTVWLGAVDNEGRAVSFIQSVYWEFGSGVVLPGTGVTWQNRGTSFSLDENAVNTLKPGRRPFHTIQPAMALLDDGRLMPYGTMGGEGQPQTQAMIYARHVMFGQDLQTAITAPRWLLGRTWGAPQTNLRLESRIDPDVIQALTDAGQDVEVIGPFDEVMGHAGAIVRHPSGLLEGAADPRGDGIVAAF